MADRKAAFTEY